MVLNPGYDLEFVGELWENADAWALTTGPSQELWTGVGEWEGWGWASMGFFYFSPGVSPGQPKLRASGLKSIQARPRSLRNPPSNH